MGEPYAVHRTRHIDIGEDDTNIALPLKNVDRFVRVGRLISVESGCLDCFKGIQPNKKFILDNEDAHRFMLFVHPDTTTGAG